MAEKDLIKEAQVKSANTTNQQVSQTAVDTDTNKRNSIVLKSVQESLTKIAEELRIAAAKLAGNVDQTTLDRLDVVGQQLDSIK